MDCNRLLSDAIDLLKYNQCATSADNLTVQKLHNACFKLTNAEDDSKSPS